MFDKKLLFADMYKMLMNDKKELEKVLKEVVKLQEEGKMRIYILTREINDSITNVLGAYKNKEQAEQEVMINKKKDDINFRLSKVVYEIQSFEVL